MFLRIFCICALICGPLVGQEVIHEEPSLEAYEEAHPVSDFNFKVQFLKMLFILALIISMIVGTVWMLKRIGRGKVAAFNRNSTIRILERRPLTQKSTLYLVEVLGHQLLIGDSTNGLTSLTHLSSTQPEPGFSTILKDKLEKQAPIACKET